MDKEYRFVSHSMALGEMPLIIPQTHQWILLSPSNSYKVLVDPTSPITLTFEDGATPSKAKFEFRETNNDGVSIYVSRRGYGAVVRRIPYCNCKLKVEARLCSGTLPPSDWLEVSCKTETGESLFFQVFYPQERVTASQLKQKVKDSLVSRGRASDNSIFSLHWNFDSPCLKPRSLIWHAPRRVALRRPAAAEHD